CTRRWATSVPHNTKLSITTPTVRRHNQHKQPVRQTGSSPVPDTGITVVYQHHHESGRIDLLYVGP
ncbi:MAG TPA: hypothetical protein VK386_00305, partial [Acidimicrobiales bacterium]|nr:hypothetical protein [Acidimicrobiales bacterium]